MELTRCCGSRHGHDDTRTSHHESAMRERVARLAVLQDDRPGFHRDQDAGGDVQRSGIIENHCGRTPRRHLGEGQCS